MLLTVVSIICLQKLISNTIFTVVRRKCHCSNKGKYFSPLLFHYARPRSNFSVERAQSGKRHSKAVQEDFRVSLFIYCLDDCNRKSNGLDYVAMKVDTVLSNFGIGLRFQISSDILNEKFLFNFGDSVWKRYRLKFINALEVDYSDYQKLLSFHRTVYDRERKLDMFIDNCFADSIEFQNDAHQTHNTIEESPSVVIFPLPLRDGSIAEDIVTSSSKLANFAEQCAHEAQTQLYSPFVQGRKEKAAVRIDAEPILQSPGRVIKYYPTLLIRNSKSNLAEILSSVNQKTGDNTTSSIECVEPSPMSTLQEAMDRIRTEGHEANRVRLCKWWQYLPLLFPSVLTRLHSFLLAEEVRATIARALPSESKSLFLSDPKISEIVQAITPRGAQENINSERLENFGSTVMKLILAQELFERLPLADEAVLTRERMSALADFQLQAEQSFLAPFLREGSQENGLKSTAETTNSAAIDPSSRRRLVVGMAQALAAVYYFAGGVPLAKQFLLAVGLRLPASKADKGSSEVAMLAGLERDVGYRFRNRGLLMEALLHPSQQRLSSNARLEFFGDAVLDLCVLEKLYKCYPTLQKGGLTIYKQAITSNSALADVASRIHLRKHLDDKNSKSVVADTLEAIIAAVYIDSGYDLEAVQNVIDHLGLIPADICSGDTEALNESYLWND